MDTGFTFEGNSLRICDFFHSQEDAEQGNPYNCSFTLKVTSHGFSGIAPFESDIQALRQFLRQLDDLYQFRCDRVTLQDIGYGSAVTFTKADRTGHLIVRGRIYGEASVHALEFEFWADQTVLLPFCNAFWTLLKEAGAS